MKKRTVLLTITLAALLSIIYGCDARRNPVNKDVYCNEVLNIGDSILRYDNLLFKDTILVPYLKRLKAQSTNMVSLPILDTCLVSLNPKNPVPIEVFNVFAEFNVVNCWSQTLKLFDELYHPTKEEVINQVKEDHVLYYCGQTFISKSFDSFLFLMEEKNITDKYGWVVRRLILLNSKEDTVMSVAEIFNYLQLAGDDIFAQTIIDDNYICHYKEVSVANDCADENGELVEGIESLKFIYDKKGHIVVL